MRLRRKGSGGRAIAAGDSSLSTRSLRSPDAEAWMRRPPIEARCGCRVDFLQIDTGEYAMVLSECALGFACPVVRYVAWEINRTFARAVDEVAAL